jgi:hypothetical protein
MASRPKHRNNRVFWQAQAQALGVPGAWRSGQPAPIGQRRQRLRRRVDKRKRTLYDGPISRIMFPALAQIEQIE